MGQTAPAPALQAGICCQGLCSGIKTRLKTPWGGSLAILPAWVVKLQEINCPSNLAGSLHTPPACTCTHAHPFWHWGFLLCPRPLALSNYTQQGWERKSDYKATQKDILCFSRKHPLLGTDGRCSTSSTVSEQLGWDDCRRSSVLLPGQ